MMGGENAAYTFGHRPQVQILMNCQHEIVFLHRWLISSCNCYQEDAAEIL